MHLRNRSTLRFTKIYTAAYEIYGLLQATRIMMKVSVVFARME